MRIRFIPGLVAVLLFACTTTKAPTEPEILKQAVDDYWQRQLENSVSLQIRFGLPTKHLPDASYAQAQRDASFAESLLRRLETINVTNLEGDDELTFRILRWRLQRQAEGLRFFWVQSPITPYASDINSVNRVFRVQKLEPAERARLIAEYGRYVDQLAEVVAEQRRRGYLVARPEIAPVRAMIASFVQPPETSFLRGTDDSAATRDAITTIANPALQRLGASLSAEYEAAAPEAVGMANVPGGADAYRWLVKVHTSLEMTPEEIHQLGLREVERIARELDQIRERVGFQGTPAEFRHFLKTDARFFAKSPEEIGERFNAYVKKIEPHIPRFFAKTPRAAYGVQRLDPALEASMTFGYYQQPTATEAVGKYFYNGSKVNERNLLFAPALMLHELIPGHHFQIARQGENEALPAFRRETYDTAFAEGWGEYSATLGREMGLYEDPYDHAGRLMMDSLLSVRLVVDTGMNALGWSRERAMQYMRENTFQSETEIATETLRYSVDIPGQALAYKVGSLKMLELRETARKALGPRFDIKAFHEWIIANGSMPLAILEQHVASEMRR